MKILLPINIDRWQSPIASLLRACVEFNPDIEFVSFSSPLSDEDHQKSVAFWNLPNVHKGGLTSILTNRFDLVHIASHTNKNLAAGTLAKILSLNHTRFLYTINLELPPSNRDTFIYKWFNAAVDDYVAVSEAASTLVKQDAPACFWGVIPNGYDPEYFSPCVADDEFLPDKVRALCGAPYVLNVAALEPRKHPEWIPELARTYPDMNFVMAGWVVPGIGERFVREIENSELPNLTWLGLVDRRALRALLQHASAFAFPSEREGLPLSVIEAMGMGVPVVAQPKSSLPELIVGEHCGSLIDIEGSDALSNWSSRLRAYIALAGPTRESFKTDLAAFAKSRFSWAAIGNAYGALYRQIVATRCR
jgi:glycosyltransferase involved in cell wall biosynthesis